MVYPHFNNIFIIIETCELCESQNITAECGLLKLFCDMLVFWAWQHGGMGQHSDQTVTSDRSTAELTTWYLGGILRCFLITTILTYIAIGWY